MLFAVLISFQWRKMKYKTMLEISGEGFCKLQDRQTLLKTWKVQLVN